MNIYWQMLRTSFKLMKMLHVSGEKVSAEACGLDSVKCARKYQTIWARKANLEIDKLKEKLGVPG